MRACLKFLVLLVSLAGTAKADEASLSVEDVLEASATHFPTILQSLAARRAAEGNQLEAQGAFDLVFGADGFSRVSGFYDGTAAEGTMRQRVRPLGADLYAAYKISEGSFPIYEDEYYTNLGGAAKLGVMFSLLRDRSIDRERFGELAAELELRAADFELLLTRIGVQQRAQAAFWSWVTAGRKLRVYENLLRIAIERQDALREQVRQGARANIFLTENLQNITRRQTLVTLSERDVAVAANNLSMYLRDADGSPVTPAIEQLPAGEELADIGRLAQIDRIGMASAVDRRPELALLRNAIEEEQNRIALARNNIKPELNFGVEVQTGIGGVGEGGVSRDSTDTIVGFTFSVPLQRRAELGRLRQSEARLDARRAEQQLAEEQIRLELRNLLLELETSRELLLLAAQEVQQSEIMRAAETRRFQSGASDFFLVNIREEVAADARIKLLEAELETRLARASFDAATVDLDRLGLTGSTYLRGP